MVEIFRLIVTAQMIWACSIGVARCAEDQMHLNEYPHFEKSRRHNLPTLHFAPRSSAPGEVFPLDWDEGAACGANCLYLLLNLEGRRARLDEVRAQLPTQGRGASMADLVQCADRHGLAAQVRTLTPRELPSSHFPLILRMGTEDQGQDGHYVVGLRIGEGGGVTLIDGTSAQQVMMPASSFNKHYTGYAIVPVTSIASKLLRFILIAIVGAEFMIAIVLGTRFLPFRR